jgi:CubicO group peptidase (beta-lactamase class C family)
MALPPVAHAASIDDLLPEFDTLVVDAMSEWKIPGLAIAVVRDGAVVLLKAYGERDVEAGLPVTTATQFTICSITKTFTSTGLALLVDERRLDWDRPVRDYVPEFRLHDDVATDRVTVRDLLCHRSGLPRHDWIWIPGDRSDAEMLAAMRYLEPSKDLRSAFQYNNLGYLAAGIVAERVSGASWEEFTRLRLTGRLGMDVSFGVQALAANADAAVPYNMDGDRRLRAERFAISTMPAGGINASIADMATWARFLLDDGKVEGQRLVSDGRVREMQTPRVHTGTSEFSEIGDTHYGLGFRCHPYRGLRTVGHGGGWIGWNTLMTLLPERGIGVVVLTNRSPSAVVDIVTYFWLDRLCGLAPIPWLDRFRGRRRAMLAQQDIDHDVRTAVRRAGTAPSHALADYCGAYAHPGYGQVAVTQVGDTLRWFYRGMAAPLAHRHYDTFELPEAVDRLLPDGLAISFATDREGNIASLSAPLEPMVKDIVFDRVAAGDCMDAAFRRACVGAYRHGPATHVVAQDADGELTLTPAGQPVYRLRPFADRIFTIVELPGFRVEFRCRPDGAVDEVVFHQPNGTFLARRAPG